MTLDLDKISEQTSNFTPTDSELLSRRILQKRMDQKYILPQDRLDSLLQILRDEFVIIETLNHNLAAYKTDYFDTQEYTFFNALSVQTQYRVMYEMGRAKSFVPHERILSIHQRSPWNPETSLFYEVDEFFVQVPTDQRRNAYKGMYAVLKNKSLSAISQMTQNTH